MKVCTKTAMERCPYRDYCEPNAVYADDCECDRFNQECGAEATTNADLIRAMTDEELVDFLWQFNGTVFEDVIPFCKCTRECGELLDSNDITDAMCKRCLLDKLQQPCEDSPTVKKG